MNKRKYPGLKMIISFIVFMVVIVVIGFIYYNNQREEIKKEKYDELSAITSLKLSQIVNWRNERIGDALVLTKDNEIFAAALKKWFDNQNDSKLAENIRDRLNITMTNYQYKDVMLIDTNGKVLIDLDDTLTTLSESTFNYFKESLKEKKPVFSDIYFCLKCSELHLDVLAPLYDGNQLICGIIFRIDPNQFLYPLIQTWPTPSPSSESLLITQIGDEVVFINELRHKKNTALRLKFKKDSNNIDIPAVAALFGKVGLIEGVDYRGIPVLADVRNIPDCPWWIITKTDLDEVYADTREKARNISIFVGMVIMFFGTGGFFMWRNQQKSLHIQDIENRLKRKALEKHFEYLIKFANDIIILTGEDLIITDMNNKALEVYGYTRDEMTGLSVKSLRAPNTQERAEKFVKILREKKEVVYETEHIRKDETIFPIELSVRLIQIEDHIYYQAIIRDISERKKSENLLIESEQRLLDVLDSAPFPVAIVDLEDENISYWSQSAKKLFGHTAETTEEWYKLAYPDDGYREEVLKRWKPFLEKAKEHGAPLNTGEYNVTCSDGSIRVCELYANFIKDNLIVTFNDVTKRNEAMNKLKEQNLLHEDIVNTQPTGIYRIRIPFKGEWNSESWESLMSKLYKVDFVSDRFCEILNIKKEDFINNAGIIPEMVYEDDKKCFAEKNVEALKTFSRFVWEGRMVVNSRIKWVHFESIPRKLDSDNVVFTGILQDIDEKKHAEEKLIESEDKFRKVFDNSLIGKSITGIDGTMLVNKSFCDILGYTKEELQNDKWKDISHPDDIQRSDEIVKSLIEGKINSARFEKRYIHKNGSTVWADVSTTIQRDANGKPMFFISAILDITEKLKAERERFKLLNVIEKSSNEIYIFSENKLLFEYVNEGALKNLGYTLEEMNRMTPLDIKPEYTEETFKALIEPLVNGKQERIVFETIHRRRDGTDYPIEVYLQLIKQDNGNLFLAIINDITERKKNEKLVEVRLNLLEYSANHTVKELLQKTLDEVCEATESPIGFYHFVNEDEQTLSLQAWSTRTIKEFCTAEGEFLHYNISDAGIWADCIRERKSLIHNDYNTIPYRKGLPEGHAEVKRELVVPIFRNGKVVSILGVGNKVTDYDEKDVKTVEFLADIAWEINMRKQAEEELIKSRNIISAALSSMNDAVFISDTDGKFVEYNKAFSTFHKFKSENDTLKWLNEYHDILNVYFSDGKLAPYDMWAVPRALRGETKSSEEYNLERKDTGEKWVGSYSFGPIRDQKGEIVGSVVVGRDITEKKEIENRIKNLNEELEQKVIERTKELEDKNNELTRMNKLFVGRELKMVELKEKIKEIETKLKDNGIE